MINNLEQNVGKVNKSELQREGQKAFVREMIFHAPFGLIQKIIEETAIIELQKEGKIKNMDIQSPLSYSNEVDINYFKFLETHYLPGSVPGYVFRGNEPTLKMVKEILSQIPFEKNKWRGKELWDLSGRIPSNYEDMWNPFPKEQKTGIGGIELFENYEDNNIEEIEKRHKEFKGLIGMKAEPLLLALYVGGCNSIKDRRMQIDKDVVFSDGAIDIYYPDFSKKTRLLRLNERFASRLVRYCEDVLFRISPPVTK